MSCFRHYKGNLYIVESIATHTEEGGELVIYTDAERKRTWARPRAMFEETVHVDGREIPRFERIEIFEKEDGNPTRLRPNLPSDVVAALRNHPVFRGMLALQGFSR